MTTILGQHISMIRPSAPYRNAVYQNERPRAKYQSRTKTVKTNSGRVIAVCIRLINGAIKALPAPATHYQVCEEFSINIDTVITTGWQLENGNYIWR